MAEPKQTILIVDDSPENIRLAANSLRKLDAALAYATDGHKALKALESQPIDLILLDINMPGLTGFDTIRRIQANPGWRDIPVIFLTANDDQENIIQGFEEGGSDYITKPFKPRELSVRAQTHLRLRFFNHHLQRLVEERTQALERSLITDHSTGVFNVTRLTMDLEQGGQRVGIMLHLAAVRQLEVAYGLERVEELLRRVIAWIVAHRCLSATSYRASHADFIFLFEGDDIDQVERGCQELWERMEEVEFEVMEGVPAQLLPIRSIAVGEGMDLLRRLRLAQIEAEERKLGVMRFDPDSMQIVRRQEGNLDWMRRLKLSLKEERLIPWFQPIVELASGKTVRYEALARIREGDQVVSPWHFIAAAKQMGVITEVTRRIISHAYQRFSGSELGLSVNLTKEDLIEGYLPEFLASLGETYQIRPHQVVLEVLEEISVFGSDQVVRELMTLKGMGYRLALDDFGSENASFSRMLRLEVDLIKIDGSFIKEIHRHEVSRKIVQGIVRMAHSLDCQVVAEFVHCPEVAAIVQDLGVDYAQGYHFSPPMEIPQLDR